MENTPPDTKAEKLADGPMAFITFAFFMIVAAAICATVFFVATSIF